MASSTGEAKGRSRVVTGMFKDRESAERAYNSLAERGYSDKEINVIMSDETRKKYYPEGRDSAESDFDSKALEGAGKGAGIGGTAGAIIGAIAAIGTSVALPGLGLVVAGPLAGALVGAGAGSATGGLVGALVGSGIPEDRAAEYERGVKDGGIVLGFNPRDEEDATHFESDWNSNRAEGIYRGETAIPVVEEELRVGKREVERGGVRVQRRVTETPVEEEVRLREEHVNVERYDTYYTFHGHESEAFKESVIEIKEAYEEMVVNKKARVVEEVVINKDVEEHTETVRETLRRTGVEVEPLEPGRARGASASAQDATTETDDEPGRGPGIL